MNFTYNRGTQVLEFHRENGMQQNVAVPEQELEKLYHCLWFTLREKDAMLDNLETRGKYD